MSMMMDYEYHDYEDEYTPLDGSGNRRKAMKKKKSKSSSSTTSPNRSKKSGRRIPPPAETTYRGKNYGVTGNQRRGCCACLCRCCSCWTVFILLTTLWTTWLTLWLVNTFLLGSTSPPSSNELGGGGGRTSDGVAELVRIPYDVANQKGAFCLDGTAPAFYFRQGYDSGIHSWILHLPDGQWCYNVTNCFQRSLTPQGSSSNIPSSISTPGLLSVDPKVNPDFYNWNVAVFHYCDGASFASNNPTPVNVLDDKTIYQRGALVLETIITHLLNETGMNSAGRVILSGTGSGGLGVYFQADRVKTLLPSHATFHALADSAFYPDVYNRSNYMHIRLQFQKLFNLHRLSENLNEDCVKMQMASDPGSIWECMFPQYAAHFIQTPLFIANSLYDPWSLWFILNIRCYPKDCPELSPLVERFGTNIVEMIRAKLQTSGAKGGAFVTSCYSNDLIGQGWDHVTISGTDVRVNDAFGAWYLRRTNEFAAEQKRATNHDQERAPADNNNSSNATIGTTASSISSTTSPEYFFIDCTDGLMCNDQCDWSRDHYKIETDRLKTMDDFFIQPASRSAASQRRRSLLFRRSLRKRN